MNIANMSIEEALRYGDVSTDAKELIERSVDRANDLQDELDKLKKVFERIDEQDMFKTELLVAIDDLLNSCTRMTEFKKGYEILKSNSYAEY